MATEILVKTGTPKIWADATDWPSGGAHGFGNDDYQIDLTTLLNGSAREGAKGDLGATRAAKYAVVVGIEFDVAPTAGYTVEFYWTSSNSATAGTGNTGGATGADANWPADGNESEWAKQLILLGVLVATADAAPTVQIQCINNGFVPPTRYGAPIVNNVSGQSLEGDAVEMFIALVPIVDEFQDA